MADEVRLMAMRFVPDPDGGRWEPVAPRGTLTNFKWAEAWEAAVTEEEAHVVMGHPDVIEDRESMDRNMAAHSSLLAKLRAAFPETVSENTP